MGRTRDYYYAVYQFWKMKQKLIADHMPTIEVAESLAKDRAKLTKTVHIVVNQVTQATISRFDGVEVKPIVPSPKKLQQPGPVTIGEAIQASRLTEAMEQDRIKDEENQRQNVLRLRQRVLCPAHWDDLNAEKCTPGHHSCKYKAARKTGVPNSYFVDKTIAPFYDTGKRRHIRTRHLGVQRNESRDKPNGSLPTGADSIIHEEGLPGPDTGSGTPTGN